MYCDEGVMKVVIDGNLRITMDDYATIGYSVLLPGTTRPGVLDHSRTRDKSFGLLALKQC